MKGVPMRCEIGHLPRKSGSPHSVRGCCHAPPSSAVDPSVPDRGVQAATAMAPATIPIARARGLVIPTSVFEYTYLRAEAKTRETEDWSRPGEDRAGKVYRSAGIRKSTAGEA